jgi:hypothetical protein
VGLSGEPSKRFERWGVMSVKEWHSKLKDELPNPDIEEEP